MKLTSVVEKTIAHNDRQIKFIEKYYSEKMNKPIRILFDNYIHSSMFDSEGNTIHIAIRNLDMFYAEAPSLFKPMFYSIILHEIGHARFTGRLQYSIYANVLEDNRLEYQIKKENGAVRFDLLRYITQDKILTEERFLSEKLPFILGLLRTIDNRKYVKLVPKEITDEILAINDEYMRNGTDISTISDHSWFTSRINRVKELVDKFFDEKDNQQDDNSQDDNSQDDSQEDESQDDNQDDNSQDDNSQDDNQEDDSQEDESQESLDENRQQSNSNGKDNIQEKEALEKLEELLDKLQDEIYDMEQKELEEQDDLSNLPILRNPQPDTTEYTKHNIQLFQTKRNTGIKGAHDEERYIGKPKEFSIKRYIQSDITNNQKYFDRTSQENTRGGKSAKVAFYLDISGSMAHYDRIIHATDYLKSFYDTMHTHIDIRLFGFGQGTSVITRNELNLGFISPLLERSTRIKFVKPLPKEQTIVITDGSFDNLIPNDMLEKAYFVLIDADRNMLEQLSKAKHIIKVSSNDIVSGLEQATKSLREFIK